MTRREVNTSNSSNRLLLLAVNNGSVDDSSMCILCLGGVPVGQGKGSDNCILSLLINVYFTPVL